MRHGGAVSLPNSLGSSLGDPPTSPHPAQLCSHAPFRSASHTKVSSFQRKAERIRGTTESSSGSRHQPTGSLWGHGHFYGNGGERPLFRQGSSMFTPRGAPQPHASHGVGETHQGARSLEGWPEPCVARDPQGLEPRGPGRPGCSRQRLGHQMLGHREASGRPAPRQGQAHE